VTASPFASTVQLRHGQTLHETNRKNVSTSPKDTCRDGVWVQRTLDASGSSNLSSLPLRLGALTSGSCSETRHLCVGTAASEWALRMRVSYCLGALHEMQAARTSWADVPPPPHVKICRMAARAPTMFRRITPPRRLI
jgi:hypothetical protein